jgi:hypothetical protein
MAVPMMHVWIVVVGMVEPMMMAMPVRMRLRNRPFVMMPMMLVVDMTMVVFLRPPMTHCTRGSRNTQIVTVTGSGHRHWHWTVCGTVSARAALAFRFSKLMANPLVRPLTPGPQVACRSVSRPCRRSRTSTPRN